MVLWCTSSACPTRSRVGGSWATWPRGAVAVAVAHTVAALRVAWHFTPVDAEVGAGGDRKGGIAAGSAAAMKKGGKA